MAIGFKSRTGEIVRACESVDVPCGIIAGGDDVSGFLSLNTHGIAPGEYITAIGVPCVVDEAESDEWARIPAWLQPISKTKPFEEQFEARSGVSADEMPEEVVIDEAVKYLDGEALSDEEKQQAIEIMTALIYHEFAGDDEIEEEEVEDIVEEKPKKKDVSKFGKGKDFDIVLSMDIFKDLCKPKLAENGVVYVYDRLKGGYVGGDASIRTIIRRDIGPYISKTNINYMLEYLYDEIFSEVYDGNIDYKRNPRYIWFKNGVYDIENDELIDGNDDMFVTNQIPVDYDPDATCDIVDEFLANIQPDPEVRRVLIEFTGYCMYAGYPEHKAAFLIGNGKNGKSTYVDFIRDIFGNSLNVSGLSMNNIQERFYIGMQLIGRFANICDDAGKQFIRMPENFKKLASGSNIISEVKCGAVKDVNPNVKLMFTMNEMPRISDGTFGSERRILIIPFNVRFDEEDKDMSKKLATEDAKKYMLKLLVDGLRNLIDRDFDFDEPEICRAAKNDYMKMNIPVLGFIEEKEADNKYSFVDKTVAEVYDDYCTYCEDCNFEKLGKNTFSKQLQERAGLVAVTERPAKGMDPVRMFKKKGA